jgi:hypothetical protein
MNLKIQQLLDIRELWLELRRKNLAIIMSNEMDAQFNEIYKTLTNKEQDEYWNIIEKL